MFSGEAEKALKAIGDRWRYNWSDFDGRTLQGQIDDWLTYANVEDNYGEGHWLGFYEDLGICPHCHVPAYEYDGCNCE